MSDSRLSFPPTYSSSSSLSDLSRDLAYSIDAENDDLEHILVVRQQPRAARMCGLGGKADRRPLDPPVVCELKVIEPENARTGPDGTSSNAYLSNPYFFMFATLASPTSEEELHVLKDGKTRYTTGSVVSSLYHVRDPENNGQEAGFFVFPDLSIRAEGSYRLKLSLFEVMGTTVHHRTSVFTHTFYVYTAKRFPGMEESTPLSCSLADQGIKIRIRKDLRVRKKPIPPSISPALLEGPVPAASSSTNSPPPRKRSRANAEQQSDDLKGKGKGKEREPLSKRPKLLASAEDAEDDASAIGGDGTVAKIEPPLHDSLTVSPGKRSPMPSGADSPLDSTSTSTSGAWAPPSAGMPGGVSHGFQDSITFHNSYSSAFASSSKAYGAPAPGAQSLAHHPQDPYIPQSLGGPLPPIHGAPSPNAVYTHYPSSSPYRNSYSQSMLPPPQILSSSHFPSYDTPPVTYSTLSSHPSSINDWSNVPSGSVSFPSSSKSPEVYSLPSTSPSEGHQRSPGRLSMTASFDSLSESGPAGADHVRSQQPSMANASPLASRSHSISDPSGTHYQSYPQSYAQHPSYHAHQQLGTPSQYHPVPPSSREYPSHSYPAPPPPNHHYQSPYYTSAPPQQQYREQQQPLQHPQQQLASYSPSSSLFAGFESTAHHQPRLGNGNGSNGIGGSSSQSHSNGAFSFGGNDGGFHHPNGPEMYSSLGGGPDNSAADTGGDGTAERVEKGGMPLESRS